MPNDPPKRPRGRPTGWTKWGEKTTVYGHSLTPTAHKWVKENKAKIEEIARQ